MAPHTIKEKHMNDIHVVRYFSSLITISKGKVIKITKPTISHCPLAGFFYKGFGESESLSTAELKKEIKKVIEDKIYKFGFCTEDRMVWKDEAVVPYGASEIMAHGLKSRFIDSAVTVCDGVGTVVTALPQVVQGIGARMHAIIKTAYIPKVAIKLRRYGCYVLSDKGIIDQRAGVAEAIKKGYKKVAVTVSAFGKESLKNIRALESRFDISLTILVVCTTGAGRDRLSEIEKYADIVWTCHSGDVKDRLSGKAIKTMSSVSPVHILTEKGVKLIAGYSPNIFGMRKETKRSVAA